MIRRPVNVLLTICAAAVLQVATGDAIAAARRPNVLVIMTDDQGYGDFGFHGNPHLRTPHLDHLAAQSVELTRFYVSPVCSPTRASLLTGRYNFRTGAIDTYLGRSTMVAEETTLAEHLAAAGYRTGIFGKWHLGDNYPSRAIDQGFAEALVHRGGGIGQPADPPGNRYFDPVLSHNGHDLQNRGYCSDVFTDAAWRFIESDPDKPFFAYLAYNCPHTPLQVPDEYLARFAGLGLPDETARLFGMIANLDDNLGRLFGRLEAAGLDKQTIVVFLTDNGPQSPRYNGALRDLKGSVYEGGIRVPCLIRWPDRLAPGRKIDCVCGHIDLVPTLLAACEVTPAADVRFDGINLLGILHGAQTQLPDRLLFFQWHRGDRPERGRACTVLGPRFKLVQAAGRGEQHQFAPRWELFDLQRDPGETHDESAAQPQQVEAMRQAYFRWFDDVAASRGFPRPRIIVGTPHENPVTLTRQDWRGQRAGWQESAVGDWEIEVPQAGCYDVTLRLPASATARRSRLTIGPSEFQQIWPAGADQVKYSAVRLPAGSMLVTALVTLGESVTGVHYVDLLALPGQTP